jgi:hypothetical protein
MKYLKLKKVKLIIIAPDLEVAKVKGLIEFCFFFAREFEKCITALLKWLK